MRQALADVHRHCGDSMTLQVPFAYPFFYHGSALGQAHLPASSCSALRRRGFRHSKTPLQVNVLPLRWQWTDKLLCTVIRTSKSFYRRRRPSTCTMMTQTWCVISHSLRRQLCAAFCKARETCGALAPWHALLACEHPQTAPCSCWQDIFHSRVADSRGSRDSVDASSIDAS